MRKLTQQRGDTLIEVMVAFAVFAMIAVGALAVMNQGTTSAQDSLETTQVRQQIDNQAEMLRYLHQAYLANPDDITSGGLPEKFRSLVAIAETAEDNGVEQATDYGSSCTQTIPGNASYRFMLDPNTGAQLAPSNVRPADHTSAPPYAQVTSGASYGLWVEPIMSDADVASGTVRYIDFHVRSCWNSAAASPQRTLGTIVRLYVPENVATGTVGGGGAPIPGPTLYEYTVNGAFANPCWPHNDVERADAEGNPGFVPFNPGSIDTTPVPQWACTRPGSAVYSCVNYDAQYDPGLPVDGSANGTYDMTISYYDADCGGGPIIDPFTFRVAVYKDGVPLTPTSEFSLSTLSGSRTIDIGEVTPSTRIQLRWWNNHHYNGMQDPDFGVSQLFFKRKS
jgi:prepilin-type N-terminal cleavage/methylation domain-containing protein